MLFPDWTTQRSSPVRSTRTRLQTISLDLGPEIIALTLGREGTLIATQDHRETIPGHTVKAVDATGAGDTFDGAFLARLEAGDDPFQAARFANAAAALSTTRFGAVAGMPNSSEVEAFLEAEANQIMPRAIVTGGTGGIGLAVCKALVHDGWHVIATGIGHEEIEAAPNLKNVEKVILDITNDGNIATLMSDVGRLDGLVNCAGILLHQNEYQIESFQRVIDVNLTGTMRMCVSAKPLLEQAGGAIVNTASMYAIFGGPHAPGLHRHQKVGSPN